MRMRRAYTYRLGKLSPTSMRTRRLLNMNLGNKDYEIKTSGKTAVDEHDDEETTIINSMGWWSGVWAGNMKVGTLQ